MNLWGFKPSILPEMEERFADFLRKSVPENPFARRALSALRSGRAHPRGQGVRARALDF